MVIIGAGLSGLAAGCVLARRSVDVTILEANSKVGGCCATTTVEGFTFHDGAVYVAAPRLVDVAFDRLGLNRAALVPLRSISTMFAATLPNGAVVTIGAGPDVRVEGKAADPERLAADVRELLGRWRPVFEIAISRLAAQPFSLWRSLLYEWKHLPKLAGTVAFELRRSISDDDVRAALAGTLLHMGVAPDKMPAASIIGLVTMLTDGLLLPEGGMGRIPDTLADAFTKLGGHLRCDAPVSRIIINNGRVSGAQLKGGEAIDASAVISTASPMTTFTALVDPAKVPASPKRSVERARLSHRAISIQFGLRNYLQPRALMEMTIPDMERQVEVVDQDPRAIKWPVYSVPTMVLPHLAPPGGSVVEMFVPVRPEVASASFSESDKQAFAEAGMNALRRSHGVDVAAMRVRTPHEFRDDMHLYEGALYGLSPAVGPHELFGTRTPIRGLFLAGQSTYPGYGVGPSLISGIFAGEAITK